MKRSDTNFHGWEKKQIMYSLLFKISLKTRNMAIFLWNGLS